MNRDCIVVEATVAGGECSVNLQTGSNEFDWKRKRIPLTGFLTDTVLDYLLQEEGIEVASFGYVESKGDVRKMVFLCKLDYTGATAICCPESMTKAQMRKMERQIQVKVKHRVMLVNKHTWTDTNENSSGEAFESCSNCGAVRALTITLHDVQK